MPFYKANVFARLLKDPIGRNRLQPGQLASADKDSAVIKAHPAASLPSVGGQDSVPFFRKGVKETVFGRSEFRGRLRNCGLFGLLSGRVRKTGN